MADEELEPGAKEEDEPSAEEKPAEWPPVMNAFIANDGLRAGWRVLIYVVLLLLCNEALSWATTTIFGRSRGNPGPGLLLFPEVAGFVFVLMLTTFMGAIEGRRVGDYGLPARETFGEKFWLGFLFGLIEATVLMGLISALGGYKFGSLALEGRAIWEWGLFHLVLFVFVGLFEEFLFRGYLLYTLAEGIGFWPAAVVLSLAFGGVHLSNHGEGPVGAAGVALVGLLFCFTLKRTGNLWYAVGLHTSFDWTETFLFSVPNSGEMLRGHLSNALLQGPIWLTGGTVGPEGSVFCFLTLGLQFLVVVWLFPAKKQ